MPKGQFKRRSLYPVPRMLYITKELDENLRKAAQQEDRSVSWIMRDAFTKYLRAR